MLYEYALDPDCLNEWNKFRYFMDQFGIFHGRLISQFPKKWKRMVHEACHSFTYIQRQKMTYMLERATKYAIFSYERHYDGKLSWLENAISQHQKKAFHAIIKDNSKDNTGSYKEDTDYILAADEITESTNLWKIPREILVERTAEDLSKAVAPLLQISDKIIFIDKYFIPGRNEHQLTLQKFIQASKINDKNNPSFEYHTDYNLNNGNIDFDNQCKRYIPSLLPKGTKIEIFRIDDKPGGEGMHARYILTNKGGVKVDWGLDISRKAGQKTIISLLDESLWEKLMVTYQYPSSEFELVDKTEIKGIL